jgi:hypothetical protein
LGMPGGRPRGLPELPLAKRPRARIRTKSLKFHNSRPGKQVITRWRRRVGNDFRHRWASWCGQRSTYGSRYVPLKTRGADTRIHRAAPASLICDALVAFLRFCLGQSADGDGGLRFPPCACLRTTGPGLSRASC